MRLAMSIQQLLIIVAIVALIFGTRRLKGIDDDSLQSQLRKELGRMPVYSAETTNGKEAEFIRERLPKRFSTAIVLVVVVVSGAVVWWLTR
jgi:hypothetical protein